MPSTLWEGHSWGGWAVGGKTQGPFGIISSNWLEASGCRISSSRASSPGFRLIKNVLSGWVCDQFLDCKLSPIICWTRLKKLITKSGACGAKKGQKLQINVQTSNLKKKKITSKIQIFYCYYLGLSTISIHLRVPVSFLLANLCPFSVLIKVCVCGGGCTLKLVRYLDISNTLHKAGVAFPDTSNTSTFKLNMMWIFVEIYVGLQFTSVPEWPLLLWRKFLGAFQFFFVFIKLVIYYKEIAVGAIAVQVMCLCLARWELWQVTMRLSV